MDYRAVGNRCAVNLDSLRLPIPRQRALAILFEKGFREVEVDVIALARWCMATSQWRRGANPAEAPAVVDCSSFIKWLYGQRGIWLPRRAIQQRRLGEPVRLDELTAGDIVFVSGWIDWYDLDPLDGVGHVGIATGRGTVIHAANSQDGVTETPVDQFVGRTRFRGARRLVPTDQGVITLKAPSNREVETADDFRWIVLQSLPKGATTP